MPTNQGKKWGEGQVQKKVRDGALSPSPVVLEENVSKIMESAKDVTPK